MLRTLVISTMLATTSVVAEPDPAPAPAPRPVEQQDGHYVFTIGPEGESLADFLALASTLLEQPIHYDVEDVAPVVVHITGDVRVAKADLRGFVEATLEMHEFLLIESDFGGSPILRAVGFSEGRWIPSAPIVSLDELDEWRHRRALVTVAIPVTHLDPRTCLGAVNEYVDARFESMRTLRDSDDLIVTAMAYKIPRIVDLVESVDRAPAPPSSAEVTRRLDGIEARLDVLESR